MAKVDYAKVVDQRYRCDLCYQTKCTYIPPHAWNIDFPYLMLRGMMEKILDVHRAAQVPAYRSPTALKKLRQDDSGDGAAAAGPTRGKVAIFVTCYSNHNHPQMAEDLGTVLRHKDIPVKLIRQNQYCGMPKHELGDLDAVDEYTQRNMPLMSEAVNEGWDSLAPIPSCALMFKQELPLMYPVILLRKAYGI